MSSELVEVGGAANNEEDISFRSSPGKCAEQRRLKLVLLGFFIAGCTFLLGMTLGVWIHNSESTELAAEEVCADFEEAPDVEDELGHGVDTLLEWFPEIEELGQNKEEIVKQIASGEEPSPNFLQKMMGWTQKLRLPAWRPQDASTETNLHATSNTTASSSLAARRLDSDACIIAITDFICSTMEFLTSLVMFTIPEKYRPVLLTSLRAAHAKFKFTQMAEHIVAFTAADGGHKAKILWKILKESWDSKGGWLKFLFRTLVGEVRAKPWEVLRVVVTVSARLAFWFEKGIHTFVGSVTFQLLNAKEMIETGRKAIKDCNIHSSPAIDKKYYGEFGV